MNATVVVLSRFPEIFQGFRESVDRDAPELEKILVIDRTKEAVPAGYSPAILDGWDCWQTGEPFQIAKNANYGWMRTTQDILYAGDDTRIIEPDTIKRLCAFAEAHPDFGIVAPRIKDQDSIHPSEFTIAPYVPFVFVLIKREVIEKIGYLDERFEGYACEDLDYCYRTRLAGFKIAYTNSIWIKHGVNGHAWGSTFKQLMTEKERVAQSDANWWRLADKYNLPHDQGKIWEAIRKM